MTTEPKHRRRLALGGTGFLLVVSIATIVTVALEAAFISTATWALLPLIMLVVVLMAVGVIGAAFHLASDGEPEHEPEPQRAGAPIGSPALLGR